MWKFWQLRSDKDENVIDPLMVLPRQQERSGHAEPRGDSHDVGHHNIGDEDQHHGERHDPLDGGERAIKKQS